MPQKRVRSFRGCGSCKTAKRRCSEERPVCRLCAKTGRLCEYDTDSLFRFSNYTSAVSRPPIAQESVVDDIDFPYFTFFLEKMPSYFEYASFFPQIFPVLLARSTSHAAMRHTILSMSAMILDTARDKPLVRFYGHRQKAISLLQQALSAADLDEGVAIAVYLFAWLDFHSGFQDAGLKHLHGLFLIAEYFRKKASHLYTIIWKMAIRMDFHSAHLSGQAPIFPPLPTNLIYEPPPWTGFFESRWATAGFVLDALWHRTCHAHFKKDVELQAVHERWLTLPIIVETEALYRTTEPTSRFLHHLPLRYANKSYCQLLNHWRGIKIYISLIDSTIGPGDPSLHRIPMAIEICRTYAAIEPNLILWNMLPLNLAGVAFGGANRYPIESKWVLQKLGECGLTELPTLKRIYLRLWDYWSCEGNYLEALQLLAVTGSDE